MQDHAADRRGAPPDAAAEARLVAAIAAHQDRDAFRQLFVVLAPAVKAFALRQGADAATADELVQDTFLTVWRKAALYAPGRGSVRSWVFTILRNLRIDRLRQAAPWQALTDAEIERAADDDRPADETLISGQIQSRVRAVLGRLPEEQAAVVTLAFVEGLSHGEIAARTGVPLGTVKTRMTLAYQKLRVALQDVR